MDEQLRDLLRAYASEAYTLKLAISDTERSLLQMRKRIEWLKEESDKARARQVFLEVAR